MKKTLASGKLYLGKCSRYSTGRRIYPAEVEWHLEEDDQTPGFPEFAASGTIWNSRYTDCLSAGQMLNELAEYFPENMKLREIVEVWRRYHLNNMHAGLPVQEEAIKRWKADGHAYTYEGACEHLKSLGLYEVPVPPDAVCHGGFPKNEAGEPMTYRYGERWICRKIPDEIIEKIKSWGDA